MSTAETDYTTDQAPEPPEQDQAQDAPSPEPENVLDTIIPQTDPKTWKLGKGDLERTYIQRELTFSQKMEWFSLVGVVLDRAMSGSNALTLGHLFQGPGADAMNFRQLSEADTFVHAVGKLLVYAPDFLKRSYCIWLSVPDHERELAMELMDLPLDQGGMSDEMGIGIIETFIDQNWVALEDFFVKRLGKLQRRIEARRAATE